MESITGLVSGGPTGLVSGNSGTLGQGGSALLDEASRALLGDAAPDEVFLAQLAAGITGQPVMPTSATAQAVPYVSGSPASGALARVRGVTASGTTWSVFVKVLQHPRHWRGLDSVPPHLRQNFLNSFPWRAELDAWHPEFTAALPPGLRVPVLYRQVELDDGRVALWMEDIDADPRPWPLARYERAARLLGTFAANRRDPGLLAAAPVPPGFGLLRYYEGPVQAAIAAIRNPATWDHPALAGHEALRGDLLRVASFAPKILDRLNQLPQAFQHGDASPQNLLIPKGDPDTIVAIDIAFQGPMPIGFDLSQLLIGLVHASEQPASALPAIHELLVPAYAAGMLAGERPADPADIRRGYLGTLLIRALFTALPWHDLDAVGPAEVAERLALMSFILKAGRDVYC
jgi:hypothetical protein